ncbi:hypothetical protein TNCV_3345411 [Trichonephila clavipes]|nr:hypothetical protein TNCV_3345411 [Trichonephila clavipes]
MDEKADAGDQLIVEVVQKAEKMADTARGEMDETPDAGDQQTVEPDDAGDQLIVDGGRKDGGYCTWRNGRKKPDTADQQKVEGSKRPRRMLTLHVEKWTKRLTLGTS